MSRPRACAKPGGERRRLAEVAAEADHAQARIARLQPRQDLEAVVRAAIVDDDDLVRASPAPSSVSVSSRCSSTSEGASLRIGMTTLRSDHRIGLSDTFIGAFAPALCVQSR